MNKINIPPLDRDTANKALAHQKILAKPPHSLGKLEPLAIQLAAMTGNPTPSFPQKAVILFSSDHDIAKHGLSLTSQDVTRLMTLNFLSGGATINAFTRNAGARLTVVDVGTYGEFENHPNLIKRKVMEGANDFSTGPAMTREQAIACIQVGIDVTRDEIAKGLDLVAAGEMGIGNTTPSSAIISVLTGTPVEIVTGRGSGIKSETIRRKIDLINQGIALNKPNPKDAIDVLAKVGGPEIGAMAGLMLAAASHRIPIVIDGFIAGAAAAIARGINRDVAQYFVGSHSSAEPGHTIIMKHIGVETYLDLGLCLGEGTGAALFFPIIDATVRTLSDMKTLPELGIQIPH
ncbi:MAG: nicotinate-nucleotide--dimethylbenzimidazole phosphoribosyltransferase [Akkermansia sp.]